MAADIQAVELTRRFGQLTAVDHISFEVAEGEVFGFLGPNGAGKTTTVRMLTGVIEPTEGTATVRGHDVTKEALRAREHIAVVPEQANVYVDLTVWENVMLMAELHGVPRRERIDRGERLLEMLGLWDRKDQRAKQLSKGLRQRAMLCSALISEPQVLFLDEPTVGLDVRSAALIRRVILELNRDGLTVFLTTHNMDEAGQLCSRVAIINEGRIVAVDTPEALRARVRHGQRVEARFEGTQPPLAALAELPGVSKVTVSGGLYRLLSETPGLVAAGLGRLASERGWQVAELCTRRPSLEEVFLQLTLDGEGK